MVILKESNDNKFFENNIKKISLKKTVLDLGGGAPFSSELKNYKHFFNNTVYYSFDFCKEYKPNIIGDIQNLPFKDESTDGIICLAVLEHIPEPQKAMREIFRILKKNGLVYFYVPFLYPYHGGPDYQDYYRFTKDSIKYMLKDFEWAEISKGGGYKIVTLRFLFGYTHNKHLLNLIGIIDKIFGELILQIYLLQGSLRKKKPKINNFLDCTTGYSIFAKK